MLKFKKITNFMLQSVHRAEVEIVVLNFLSFTCFDNLFKF